MNNTKLFEEAKRLRERVFALQCAVGPYGTPAYDAYEKAYFDAISLCDDLELLWEAKSWLLAFTWADTGIKW